MAAAISLLQALRRRTTVDCDTMDVGVAKSNLGPFVDCTSNQAIAYFELSKPENERLVQESIAFSTSIHLEYPEATAVELAVEIAMIKLQLEISKYITGFVHVQSNPYHSYSTDKTVQDAQRILELFKRLDPAFDTSRVCIKIPSTWEGLQACRKLEAIGVTTLATTLFTLEQVAVAGEVKCHYIAPYVNELRVHFDSTFTDTNKLLQLCADAQLYYKKHMLSTQVLPASLTSTSEIMALAGIQHITIAPSLLEQLAANTAASDATLSVFDELPATYEPHPLLFLADDEAAFRIAFTRRDNGEGERKLGQAINIFCDMQSKIEEMMKK